MMMGDGKFDVGVLRIFFFNLSGVGTESSLDWIIIYRFLFSVDCSRVFFS